MGYDLHIVRTEDWTKAANAPITRSEVDALIAADSELAWSTTDSVDMKYAAGASTRRFMITWRGAPCFWWDRDHIQCSDPDDAQQAKLIEMARALSAATVGDDGEIYPLEQPRASAARPPAPPSGKPWLLRKQLIVAFLIGCVLLALKLLICGH